MADKRKGKKRKEDQNAVEEEDKTGKDEYKVAKWMRKNVLSKKTKFMGFNVEYFTGTKAVDALLESPFAETLFPTRNHVIDYLDKMLRHKFFHRALKVPISEKELEQARKRKKKNVDKEKEKAESEKESKEKDEAESSHAEGRSDDPSASPKPTKEPKKRKIRLEMHMQQMFVDGLDAYVWIYEPVPLHYWIFGSAVVLGAVAICLFPLWPPEVRKGVYYLSIAGAGFLCLIIALAVLRLVVFCILWMLTLGRHHLWLLPNLTEDVGFFASFWPLYHYEYQAAAPETTRSSKRKKKDKDSDDEAEADKPEPEEDAGGGAQDPDQDVQAENNENTEGEGRSESESESSSQKSQTGKDFEIIDKKDVEDA